MLAARELAKRYKSVQAIDGLSFEVAEGELFGLIGPDGAGKSTLFRILATLLLPDSGGATLDGLDLVRDFRAIRARVGYMPGRFSLYQDLSVEENLTFFASVFGVSVEENRALVDDIYRQIEPFKQRRAGALSGGMKQKLALCCALIHRPRLLFLDEPTTGVDPVSRREFWEMLLRLRREGLTILVSTPYMDEATLCDRVALIQRGRFLQVDRPEAIVQRFGRPLLAVRAAKMSRALGDLRSHPEVLSSFAFGDTHHVTTALSPEALAAYLVERGHTDVEIHAIEPSIEDCFMELAS